MDFAAASDRFVAVAWAVGLLAFGAAAGLTLQVLVLRGRRARRERRRERVFATWRPLMFEYVLGEAPGLPPLPEGDEESFLILWNQLQDGLRGEPRRELNRLAEAVGARDMARRRLQRGDALGRLLGLRTLGYVGRPSEYHEVVRHLDDRRPYVCLAAAGALAHIDAGRAPDDLLPRLASRLDWPVSQFATVLRETEAVPLAARFRRMLPQLSSAELVRLLPLATILEEAAAEEILADLLASCDEAEVLSAALKRARGPRLRQHVRRACGHAAWPVRAQAAAALGRIGVPADRDVLVPLLGDAQWWVRYRAAQALVSGPFGSPAEIAGLAAGLGDRFARDIVQHALAEGRG